MLDFSLRSIIAALILGFFLGDQIKAAVISGQITDYETSQPVPHATVRVLDTDMASAANDDGRFRLKLPDGKYRVKFSHIAHYSEIIDLTVAEGDSALRCDVPLRPSVVILKGIKAYSRAYDPGQRIILEAIKRKKEILNKLQAYSFEAYTRLVVTDQSKDTNRIMIITETQLQGFWEKPDQYKEIITSRRQTANMKPEYNMVTVGQILNFNQSRIELDRYSVVSPTAEDAFDYYNYYLLDTFMLDNRPVFRLEIEPKSQAHPLFVGTIDIIDSTFEVGGVEVGLNEGFDTRYVSDVKYIQVCAPFENGIWMPVEIRFGANIDLKIPILPRMAFNYAATLSRYHFDRAMPPETFDEYAIEVAESADSGDSTAWLNGFVVPLTVSEVEGYRYIDSVENAPKPLWKKALLATLGLYMVTLTNPELFHYNRVEGAFLGIGNKWDRSFKNLEILTELGWAFKHEDWQHRLGLNYNPTGDDRLWLGAEYHDKITARPTLSDAPVALATLTSLYEKYDPFDYYLEEGFNIRARLPLAGKTDLHLQYNDYLQYSLVNRTRYSFVDPGVEHRPNPPISDGRLRSLIAEISYDSRPLAKNKGRREILQTPFYTRFDAGVEQTFPDYIDSDFNFRRYYLSLKHNQRLWGLGVTKTSLYAGYADRAVPPQKFFTIDFGGGLTQSDTYFKTLGENNFTGNRVFSGYLYHDFGRAPFALSGLPLIKDLPVSLGIYGGAFYTRFKDIDPGVQRDYFKTASDWYTEAGFALGKIPPLDFKFYFTWRLSAHETEDFVFGWGLDWFFGE